MEYPVLSFLLHESDKSNKTVIDRHEESFFTPELKYFDLLFIFLVMIV
jgi:hypothetical protein